MTAHFPGLLRSGNIKIDLDVVCNAASLGVDKFLRLELDNNLTILQNLEQNTDYIRTQFGVDNFDEIRNNFLKIKKSGLTTKSSDKLKQIYWSVGDDYHLLSLLTPSAIVYKLKQRINENFQPFSERNEQEKEKAEQAVKDKKELKGDLNSIWNLTEIGYGGAKPLNISVLNNQNGGIAYLLSSMPLISNSTNAPIRFVFFFYFSFDCQLFLSIV
jgi:CRISPR-associated protein Csy1